MGNVEKEGECNNSAVRSAFTSEESASEIRFSPNGTAVLFTKPKHFLSPTYLFFSPRVSSLNVDAQD